MKRIYQILLVCLLMQISLQGTYAQKGGGGSATVTVNGPTFSSVNATETYTITASPGLTITAANWSFVNGGGIIQSSNINSATIQWTSAGTHTIKYVVTASNYGVMQDRLDVTVNHLLVAPPNTPSVTNIGCTSAELVSNGPVPSGQTWYWQGTNASGTSTANPSTTNYIATSSGAYYIRALESGTWSPATSVSVTLSVPMWYADGDGDGLGDPNVSVSQCSQPTIGGVVYVSNNSDQCPNEHGGGSATGCQTPITLSPENYVYTIVPQKAVTDVSQLSNNKDALKTVTYIDGLGRPKQNVQIRQSATEKDIVIHVNYDQYGREAKKFLPYASTSNTGAIKSNAEYNTKSYYKTAYASDFTGVTTTNTNPYDEQLFEASPLNRVVKEGAPGEDWKIGNGHEVRMEYGSNSATEVRHYEVSLSSDYIPTLVLSASNGGYFKESELYKLTIKNENWMSSDGKNNTVEEFKNKEGQVVLKRHYSDYDLNLDGDTNDLGESSEVAHDTYYVYDEFGNLTYVLPPKAEAHGGTPNTLELSELCYQYKYDKKNRVAQKKLPGKGWESFIYDKLDRPVMTQDALQYSSKEWLFTKYDKLGRVTYSGIYTHSSEITQTGMQSLYDSTNDTDVDLYETRVNSGTGVQDSYYSSVDFPSNNIEILVINYYDDYAFDLAGSAVPQSISYVYANSNENNIITTRTKGLATGTKVKVLGEGKWITTVNYYDERARLSYIYSYNDYLKTTDVVQTDYDFAGKVLETTKFHTKSNSIQGTVDIIDRFTYDHVGRLIEQRQSIEGANDEVIAFNTYDEIGTLQSKGVGGKVANTRLQTINYAYNVRGWLKNINEDSYNDNDLFDFTIRYNNPISGQALYNGNISQTSRHTANADNSVKTYTYSYDALNRLLKAVDNTTNYNLSLVNYDKNGNITKLQRNGHRNAGATSFGLMDNLDYDYNPSSNKLKKVQELSGGHAVYGFKDGSNDPEEYYYDANGNMTKDTNKGISLISYNHLNLPKEVTINGNTIEYIYDAIGTKLKKIAGGVSTEYAGTYVYENNLMQYFSTRQGYAYYEGGTTFSYVYHYKDHLDNIRLAYRDIDPNNSSSTDLEILSEKNYYPFGLNHKGYNETVSANANSTAELLGFTGKEHQDEFGLQWIDITARNYDAALGRWMNLDPLAEQMRRHSPYNYGFDNPVYYLDPDGMAPLSGPNGAGNAYGMNADGFAGNPNRWNHGLGGKFAGGGKKGKTTKGGSIGVHKTEKEGVYEVVSSEEDGLTGIYLADDDKKFDINKSEKLGEQLTTHSFRDDKGNLVEGAEINMNSREGENFVKQVAKEDPNIIRYALNAGTGERYDLKDKGLTEALKSGLTEIQHRYRGSKTSDGYVGSARDFGNFAAGMVVGLNGMGTRIGRMGFDLQEMRQHYNSTGEWDWKRTEALTSKLAQQKGYDIGKLLMIKMHTFED